MHHRRRIGRQGSGGAGQNDLRFRTLRISSGGEVHCTRRQLHRNIRLLRRVGRVFLDHDQRVLLDGVVGVVRKYDFGQTFRSGLDDVALLHARLVVGIHPGIAVRFFHAHGAVNLRESRLVAALLVGRLVGLAEHPADGIAGLRHQVLTLLGEHQRQKYRNGDHYRQNRQQNAAVGHRRPGKLDALFLFRRHDVFCLKELRAESSTCVMYRK